CCHAAGGSAGGDLTDGITGNERGRRARRNASECGELERNECRLRYGVARERGVIEVRDGNAGLRECTLPRVAQIGRQRRAHLRYVRGPLATLAAEQRDPSQLAGHASSPSAWRSS